MSIRLISGWLVSVVFLSHSPVMGACMSSRMAELENALNEKLPVADFSNGVSAREFAFVQVRLGGYLKSALADIEAAYFHERPVAKYDIRGGSSRPVHPALNGRVEAHYNKNVRGVAWVTLVFKDGSQANIDIPAGFLSGPVATPMSSKTERARLVAPVMVIAKRENTQGDHIYVDDVYLDGQFQRLTNIQDLISNSGLWEVKPSRTRFATEGGKQICLSSYIIEDDRSSIIQAYAPAEWRD